MARIDTENAALRVVAPPPASVSEHLPRILIVDDNELNRRLLAGMLSAEESELLIASNGLEGIELATTGQPDLILLDVMMPGIDGFEVCDRLKQDPKTTKIPVIFLSALSEPRDKIRGLEKGAVDYITKPFNRGEVLARVRLQLRLARLTRDLRTANATLRAKERRIDEDLRAAAGIQRCLMPKTDLHIDGLDVSWKFRPCDHTGGDLLNFHRIDDRHVAAYIIDVSGHGVPAAMMTVAVSQFLMPMSGHIVDLHAQREGNPAIVNPSRVLDVLDEAFPIERFSKHLTMAYMVFDLDEGHIRFSRAGHPPPILQRTDGSLQELDAGGPIIGLGGLLPFQDEKLRLEVGDRIFLYTDGIVEASDADGKFFGEQALFDAVLKSAKQPLETVCDSIIGSLDEFRGGHELDDDVTLLAVEYRGASAASEKE